LTSSTIVWETTATFTGVVGTEAASGSASYSLGGSYWVGNSSYAANGSGGGNGGPTGSTISVNLSPFGNSTEFLPSGAGPLYNPAILAAFLGVDNFSLSYGSSISPNISPYSFFYTNIASGSASITTTATLTFDYEPVPGPLPLLGIGAAWGWSRRLRQRCGTGSR
jgi:MYXO-CTERM domain-containing protein